MAAFFANFEVMSYPLDVSYLLDPTLTKCEGPVWTLRVDDLTSAERRFGSEI